MERAMFRLLSALSPLVCVALAANAMDIVKDGKPAVFLVTDVAAEALQAPISKKTPEYSEDTQAVTILQEWIKLMTGAELVMTATAPEDQPAIYIGKKALSAGLKLDDIESPSREGLRIKIDGNKLLIAGQSGKATTKAVCRFLETLGCRYLMDGELGKIYPRTKNLAAGELNLTEKPGLIFRNPKGPNWRGGYWGIWNGAGGTEVSHAHSWSNYIPKELFERHPDFFALNKGGERKPSEWLCTSNPELRKYFTEQVSARIKAGSLNPSLSPTDGVGYCQCANCKAQDDPGLIEPSNGTIAVSPRYADFFNAIGEIIAKEHPLSILSFYCYADYTQPPRNKQKLAPNLCAFIAPIRYCRMHPIGHPNCPSRVQQQDMIEGWAAIASRIGYYNYMYDLAEATFPVFKFTGCKKDMAYLKSKGLAAMTIEVLTNWHIYGPQIYLSLRLAYDPDADADAIMEDYWRHFYGPAAAHMKTYWMSIDEALLSFECHAGGFCGIQQMYTRGLNAKLQDSLTRAAEVVKNDAACAERVAMAAGGFQNVLEYQAVCAAMEAGDFQRAEVLYDKTVARIGDMIAKGYANREYGSQYLKRFLWPAINIGAERTKAPAKVLSVFPDEWLFSLDENSTGVENRFHSKDCDETRWSRVSTFSRTLDAQGKYKTGIMWYRNRVNVPAAHQQLKIYFSEVDGACDVFVNGQKLDVTLLEREAPPKDKKKRPEANEPPGAIKAVTAPTSKRRAPFEVDITSAVKTGENLIAIRVDHTKITELFLGGIIRPVLLFEQPK
jgi:hypothetical protein